MLPIADQQCAALSHAVIFGFMEAVAAIITDAPKGFSFIRSHHALRRILNHKKVVTLCDIHDRIHFAGYSGVVHRHDGLRLFGDRCFDLFFVNIHGIRTNIHKNRHAAPQHKRICRGNKCVRRHNNFIPRFDIRQNRGKLRRMGTGSRHQALRRSGFFFKPATRLFGKFPVSADLLIFHCLAHIFVFPSRKRRYIEPDFFPSGKGKLLFFHG